jgi:hypothetical protein
MSRAVLSTGPRKGKPLSCRCVARWTIPRATFSAACALPAPTLAPQRSRLQAIEYPVLLFLNADKGGAFGQLFQSRGANDTARDILGGLRSACTYVGASRLKELTKRTTFIRVQARSGSLTVFPSAARYFATPPTWRVIADSELIP